MKPVFIVRAPSNIPSDNIKMVWEYLQQGIVNDYHPIIVYDNTVKEWAFELYNVQNATEIEIEELKKEVLKNIKDFPKM
jgi:hypothetical protein